MFSIKKNLFLILLTSLFLNSVYTQNFQGIIQKFKKKEQQASGAKVAIIPFDYTFEAGDEKAKIALNEIAVSMIESGSFQPLSLSKWINSEYKDKKSDNIAEIIRKARRVNIPVDFICHGIIFKSGTKYGLKIAMYPMDTTKKATYYFRYFSNFYTIKYKASQIVEEMSKRADIEWNTVVDKTIFIKNFDVKYSLYSKSKTGKTEISDIPFIKLDGVEYRKHDNFLNELLLYNFHISRAFNIENSNVKDFADSQPDAPPAVEYVIMGSLDISKNNTELTIEVVKNSKRDRYTMSIFTKKYSLKNLDLDYLYEKTRIITKSIIITLLKKEEQMGNAGEFTANALYGNDNIFCDDFYLGKGDQKDLILPLDAKNITLKFYKDWQKTISINISPWQINKVELPFFKVSLGLTFISGFLMHPIYNDEAMVTLNSSYKLSDIYQDGNIDFDFVYKPGSLFGGGIDLTLESKYFALTQVLSVRGAEYFRNTSIDGSGSINLNGNNVEDFKSVYDIKKFSIITDYSFLPNVLILPSDFNIRIYTGLGFFLSLWYNQFDEKISGDATVNSVKYEFNNEYSEIKSLFLTAGIFPEIGLLCKFSKFNLKIGVAYYLEIFKYNAFSENKFGILDKYDTSSLLFKISFGYYLN